MDVKKRTFLDVLNDPHFEQTLHDAGMFYVDYERDFGSISKVCSRLGFSMDDMTHGSYIKKIHPDDIDNYTRLWNRFTRGQDDELYCEYRLMDSEGVWNWILTHAAVLKRDESGAIATLIGFDRIINNRKNTEQILHDQLIEQKKRTKISEIVLSAGADVVSDLYLTEKLDTGLEKLKGVVDFDCCSIYLNKDIPTPLHVYPLEGVVDAMAKLKIYSVPLHVYPLEGVVDIPRLEELLSRAGESKYPIIEEVEAEEFRSVMAVPLMGRDSFIGVMLLCHKKRGAYNGTDLYPVLSFADILTIAVLNKLEMSGMVSELETDQLTGFLTRKSFDRTIKELFEEEDASDLVVAMVDIDHFKRVNDTYGHQKGDEAIHIIARVCSHTLRGNDILGRFGGEEFIILLSGTSVENAGLTMERIRRKIEETVIPGIDYPITVSIGLSGYIQGDTVDSLIKRSDEALYAAKHGGRNRTERR